jgi:hypothetical protein
MLYLFPVVLAVLILPIIAQAQSAPSVCPFVWTQNLKVGSTGNDALKLQQFLNASIDTMVASSGPGSPGSETPRFGSLTAKAVVKFQEKYAADILSPTRLTKGTGAVGAMTRAKLNALCSTVSAAQATPSAPANTAAAASVANVDQLTISAGEQPAQTIAPAGAGGVPFTNFTLAAGSKDVTVKGIMVERAGPGADGAFADIALADKDGNAIGNTKFFDSKHKVAFNEPMVIAANTSQTYNISGDMAADLSGFDGQVPYLQVDSIDASSPVVGALPIRGTAQPINSTLVIGSATAALSSWDPNTSSTHYINETGIRFSGVRITANATEDLTLSSIAWNQGGTAGSSDVVNVATVVNGVSYPAQVDGRTYTSTFSPGIAIKKGQSVEMYVQGDLTVGGSNRTVEFDIDSSGDVALTGNTYGFLVPLAAGSNTAQSGHSVFITSDGSPTGDEGSPFFAGSVVTISGGAAVSIGR